MKTVLVMVLVAWLLKGCATTDGVVTKEVKVVVEVPCKVEEIAKPVMPMDSAKVQDSFEDKIKKAIAEIYLRRGYEEKLEAAIKGCNKQ
jgi:entry exclusion lipoprotein TrbK